MSGFDRAGRRAAALVLAAALALSACAPGTDPDDSTAEPQRNVALGTGTLGTVASGAGSISPTGEPGGVIDAAYRLRGPIVIGDEPAADVRVLTPDIDILPETVRRAIDAARAVSPYLPVVARLPVAFDPSATAARLAKPPTTPGVRWPDGFHHGTSDPTIAAAAIALYERLTKLPGWTQRSVRMSQYVAAAEAAEAAIAPQPQPPTNPTDPSNEQNGQSGQNGGDGELVVAQPVDRTVRAASHVAQLGQTPFVRALLTADEIELLLAEKLIAGVEIDQVASTALRDETDLIGSRELATYHGYTGAGTSVAVLDTGILGDHPAFTGRIVDEGCWALDSTCVGGTETSRAAGSGEPCVSHNSCDHGTHVAGIVGGAQLLGSTVTGNGVSPEPTGYSRTSSDDVWSAGVAPKADLLAFRIFNESVGGAPVSAFASDYVAALGAVSEVVTRHNVVAANMSIGGSTAYSSPCDDDVASTTAAIEVLVEQNVAVVIAAGNQGWTNSVSRPGCVSSAITVSAVGADDEFASYTNVTEDITDLLAPGGGSPCVTAASATITTMTANYEAKCGTSMATPMVAGVWAMMRAEFPGTSVAAMRRHLRGTGELITDNRSGGSETIARVDLTAALLRPTSSGLATSKTFGGSRQVLSTGGEITRGVPGLHTGSIDITPAAGTTITTADLEYAVVYLALRSGRLDQVTLNGFAVPYLGEQVGYSETPCRDVGPTRTYRVQVDPTELVIGVNTLSITTTSQARIDGASMVVVGKRRPVVGGRPAVIIADGAAVLNAESPVASAALTGAATLDRAPVSLHLGVADGQRSAAESGVLMRTSTDATVGRYVTAANGFTGTSGALWENRVYDLSGAGLTGSPGIIAVSHDGISGATVDRDCLTLTYALLHVGAKPVSAGVTAGLTAVVRPTAPLVISGD